jgi:hypothetical protein
MNSIQFRWRINRGRRLNSLVNYSITMGYLVKTNTPVNVFILLFIIAIIISQSIFNPVWLLYGVLIFIFLYVLFSRYCCRLLITEQTFEIHYFAPWNKNVNIRVEDIIRVDYATGFYNFSSNKPINRYYGSMQYCYDRIILFQKDKENPVLYLNVNTRAFEFDKILKWAVEKKLLDKI